MRILQLGATNIKGTTKHVVYQQHIHFKNLQHNVRDIPYTKLVTGKHVTYTCTFNMDRKGLELGNTNRWHREMRNGNRETGKWESIVLRITNWVMFHCQKLMLQYIYCNLAALFYMYILSFLLICLVTSWLHWWSHVWCWYSWLKIWSLRLGCDRTKGKFRKAYW